MDKQPRADKDMQYRRVDLTGQHKKERPKLSNNKKRRKESQPPG